jgi:hypothetical protein
MFLGLGQDAAAMQCDAGGYGHFAGRRQKTPAAPGPIVASQSLSYAQTAHEWPLPQKLALPVVLK